MILYHSIYGIEIIIRGVFIMNNTLEFLGDYIISFNKKERKFVISDWGNTQNFYETYRLVRAVEKMLVLNGYTIKRAE